MSTLTVIPMEMGMGVKQIGHLLSDKCNNLKKLRDSNSNIRVIHGLVLMPSKSLLSVVMDLVRLVLDRNGVRLGNMLAVLELGSMAE
jgi:hypothetical protein